MENVKITFDSGGGKKATIDVGMVDGEVKEFGKVINIPALVDGEPLPNHTKLANIMHAKLTD